ncbi:helix-turn-helix domain-containing protein [Brevibacillus sp. SIMBA_040]|uniref:helix-turn-helix domain-containing protein n=1 Tax=unclassified Brevibacillus TaxID=2684853 RepID=UPI00397E8869
MPHEHDEQYQVTIPVQGTCFFTHENKAVKLPAGEGLILHLRDRHSFHIGHDASVIIIRVKDQCMHVLLLRIGKAKELLLRSATTVTDISFTLGFSSPSQFFRIFAKQVGATPEQYRVKSR